MLDTETILNNAWPCHCIKCDWKGMSNEATGMGEMNEKGEFAELVCPKCLENEQTVFVKTIDEI